MIRLRELVDRVRFELEEIEAGLHRTSRATVGLRILDRVGWTQLARLAVSAVWILSILQVATIFRPDLIHPSDIGTDSSNYIAAAERMAAGHDVYALAPGDRPVPLDNPPDWTVPILSPPTVATAHLWTLVLPDGIRLYPAWAIGLAGTIAVGFLAAALAPPIFLLLVLQLMPGLAITAWSGNVNALIVPAILFTWWGTRSESRVWQTTAGIVIAIAICVKLGPAMIGFWVLMQGRRAATAAMIVTGLGIAAATVVFGGIGSVTRYLEVVRAAAANPTNLSIPGSARAVGIPEPLASLLLPVFLLAIIVAIVFLRTRREAFLLAVIGTVFATAVVRYDSIGIVVAAGAIWAGDGLLLRRPTPDAQSASPGTGADAARTRTPAARTTRLAIGIATVVTVIAIADSVITGGLVHSSLTVSNTTNRPVVARLTVVGQDGTYGFRVPAGDTIVGWRDVGGASPPLLTIWTEACELVGRASLPRPGGGAVVDQQGVSVAPAAATGTAAAYVPDCAVEQKAEHLRP